MICPDAALRFEDAYVDDMFDERRELREAGQCGAPSWINESWDQWIQMDPGHQGSQFHDISLIEMTDVAKLCFTRYTRLPAKSS